jgi:glycerol-3-phosphate dehydrogenase
MKASEISKVDLAIIGGGINGAGLAAQAARFGLSVVLFEKADFGSGASSKSTKLIHGGIRYLEQAKFSLVFEALHERHRLLNLAPHLVHPIPFLLPIYKNDIRPPWMIKVGLWLYDLLAGAKNIARHQWLSPSEAIRQAPVLNSENLLGCGVYYDAQVNDARLVLENILAAENLGAHCYNYCRISQIDRQSSQIRLFYHHELSGEEGTITASCLVNASGPWSNQTAKLVSEEALRIVRPTRGSHIVVPEILPHQAVLVMSRRDNRVIFIIPWRGNSLVGTTDLDDPSDPDQVHPTEEEISYLLQEAARVLPKTCWDRCQVISAFAGLRPLAWSDRDHVSTVSREDKIMADDNLFFIIGGKLTTYHSMAQKTLKLIFKYLEKKQSIPKPDHLPGSPTRPWDLFLNEEAPRWISQFGIKQDQANHLACLYGQKAESVLELLRSDPRLYERLHPSRPEILAQVAHAVKTEKAVHLEDVLLRRLEIGYSKERWGESAEKTSQWMAEFLNWDENKRQEELGKYRQRLFPPP